jgi:hypothetical protein
MFPLNQLYTFYTSDITPSFLQHTSYAKVNDVDPKEQLTSNTQRQNSRFFLT